MGTTRAGGPAVQPPSARRTAHIGRANATRISAAARGTVNDTIQVRRLHTEAVMPRIEV
jgi:hypothetical protein